MKLLYLIGTNFNLIKARLPYKFELNSQKHIYYRSLNFCSSTVSNALQTG